MHLYIHFLIAVTYKTAVIQEEWEDQLHNNITEIVHNNRHKMLAINSLPDHLHMFINMNPSQSISDMMKLIKEGSAEFINSKKFTQRKFYWQEGYGAFSNSLFEINTMVNTY